MPKFVSVLVFRVSICPARHYSSSILLALQIEQQEMFGSQTRL